MNQHSPLKHSGSLLERAAELYGFSPQAEPAPVQAEPAPVFSPAPTSPSVVAAPEPAPIVAKPAPRRAPPPPQTGPVHPIDRRRLRQAALIEPEAPVGALAEEFRIVKRQLLLNARAMAGVDEAKQRTILVSSAQPGEGKTFCALNLALSISGEPDTEVLLVDGDFPNPQVLATLGLDAAPGLVDAIADPRLDPESLVLRTDLPGLSILPAGRQVPNVTELLASERARDIAARLAEARSNRIILFDSPPALMASPATVLAGLAGQLVMVVRADRTSETDLREALELLTACERVSLLLNGAGFAAGSRRFGAYYGYGQ
ncbi:MAG: AAA family ATPase [Alphaproteobacteria bacterium]|nr:AAA family ATPase [Alphaproteobacteria bacterium]